MREPQGQENGPEQSSTGTPKESQISENSHDSDEAEAKSLEELPEKAYEDDEVVKEIMDGKTRGLRKLQVQVMETRLRVLRAEHPNRTTLGREYLWSENPMFSAMGRITKRDFFLFSEIGVI